MNYNVPMPSLGADMDQGKLMQWKIMPGELVKKGQTIAIIETTKSTVEIESFREGKVLELLAHEGEDIPVGSAIAVFEVQGQHVEIPQVRRPQISPAAKKLALEHGLDLNQIKGTAKEAQVELKDVELYLKQRSKVTAPVAAGSNLRQAIARAMTRSKKEIPHYYLKQRISLDPLIHWLDEENQRLKTEERLMLPVVLMKAIILALKQCPEMNGHYVNGVYEKSTSIHLGVAVALKGGGVLVPAIMDAQDMSLQELNRSFQELLVRARKGHLKNRELTEGTITITNVGDLGTDEVFGIIFPPQVALVGLGRVQKTAVVDDGVFGERFVIDLTLSADHRVSDGLTGASFIGQIEKKLLNPASWEKKDEYEHLRSEIRADTDLPRSGAGDRV
jgi:pyruvate dehydrogenase E2 component (dihydrolipoamide acetyltransferase)